MARKVYNIEEALRPGEDPLSLIKRFTRKVAKDGILKEHAESLRYKKPSEEAHEQRRRLKRRLEKERNQHS